MAGAELLSHDRDLLPEQTVIGSMLIDPSVTGLVMAGLHEQDFVLEANRRLFRAFQDRFAQNKTLDPVLVCQDAGPEDKELRFYALQLMDITPTAANVEEYIEAVRNNTRLTRLRELGQELTACVTQEDAGKLLQRGQDLLADHGLDDEADMERLTLDFFNYLERKPDYLSWGFPLLDENLEVSPGMFVVLGGRPSDGKTALALHMAYAQAQTKNVGFFTLEDSRELLFARLKSSTSGVPLRNILRRNLRDPDYKLLADTDDEITRRKLTIIDSAGWTVNDIITRTHAKKFDVIYVDYLQMIRPANHVRGTRQDEVADISRSLADLARHSGIVVVALAQLSRPAQKSKRESPLMADLKESGQIEQDANVIMFIWREDETSSKSARHLTLAKNKLGLLGQWGIVFDGATQRFQPDLQADKPVAARKNQEDPQASFYDLPNDTSIPW